MTNVSQRRATQRYGFSITYAQALVLRDALEEELAYHRAISKQSNVTDFAVEICATLLKRVDKIINNEKGKSYGTENYLSANVRRSP